MNIDETKVLDLATQIYLGLTKIETKQLAIELTEIINNMNVLNEIDVTNIKRDIAVLNNKYNSFRKDEVIDYTEKELLLQNLDNVENNMYMIPRIV